MPGQPDNRSAPSDAIPASLFENYREKIYRHILKQVRDPLLAEDLVQETYLRFHKSYASLSDKSALGSWLYSVATHLCLDHFRAVGRERSRLSDAPAEAEQPLAEPEDPAPLPERVTEKLAQST